MRIALVTDYYLPTLGGVQTAVKAQAEMLRAAGHEVTVFCPLAEPSTDPEVVELPVSGVFRPDGYPFAWTPRRVERSLTREFAERGIEVVHTHSEMFAALGGIRAAQSLGIPLVYTVHGRIDVYTANVLPLPSVTTHLLALLHRRRVSHRGITVPRGTAYTRTRAARAMWRLMLAQARASDHVIVPSAHVLAKLTAQGLQTPATVLSNSLEESLRLRIARPETRSLAPGESLRMLWVGRLSPEKRPVIFAQAIRLLETEAPAGAARTESHVYGEGFARASVERIGAPVHLHGAVPQAEVLDAMRRAHLFVSTSHDFDNQPMAILEAIGTGLPVVYCDPDLTELLPPGAGFLAPTPDAAGVARVVRDILADPESLTRASAAAVAAHESVFGTADGLVGVYEEAIASH